MKLGSLFKKTRYVTVSTPQQKSGIEAERQIEDSEQKPNIPDGMWVKCEKCGNILYKKDLEEQMMVCTGCKTHLRMTAWDRISLMVDPETFEEFDSDMITLNPLDYPGYGEKIERLKAQTELNEAVITGKGSIYGTETIICVMDSRFMMASMGCVVGEKITRAVETATKERLPLVIFTASGGARMQEGIYSLMQMAKVSAAVARHSEEGLLYITVLTDPTTGGVTASFAMLGDIIISEPGALIGFAGRRVIEQTVKEKLPDGFQKAEFLLKHGFIDCIVERSQMKDKISNILKLHVRR